jgi:tetratricopeptide (TPR) repeat protein
MLEPASEATEPASPSAPEQTQNPAISAASLLSAKWLPYLLLGVVTFLLWGHTLKFGFVWDDNYFIKNLQVLRSWHRFPEIFYRLDAQSTMPKGFLLFRPVRTAIYAVLCHLGGKDTAQPWLYHLANVLWHGATAMILFSTLLRLVTQLRSDLGETQARVWSFLTALAFVVHPVVSEVVCWAKSLDDILAAFFVLAALRELLDPLQRNARRWWALFYFALAIYSKESAVPFALLPLVISHVVYRLPWKQSLARTIPFLAVAFIYTLHRHFVIGRTSQIDPISGTYGQTLLDMLPVVPKYFRLLWGIGPFSIDYTYMKGGYPFLSGEVLAGLLLLSTLVGVGVLAWRSSKTTLTGFGLLWAALFLLPVSNLVPMMQYMAERFLYLPLIGWLIAFASLALLIPARKAILVGSSILLCIWMGTASYRSWIWQDEFTLFVRTCMENPQTWRLRQNAMAAILELPPVRELMAYDPAPTPNQQHSIPVATQREALDALSMGCRLFPKEPPMLSAYGICLAKCGLPQQALPLLENAAQLETTNVNHLVNLAKARVDLNQLDAAKAVIDKATLMAPDDVNVLQIELKADWLQQDYSSARQVLLKLNRLAPSAENSNWLFQVEKKLSDRPTKP